MAVLPSPEVNMPHTHILFRIFVKKSATFLPPKTVGRVVVVSIFQKLKVNDRSDMESRCSRSHGFHSGSLLTVLVCCDLIRCERIVLRHFFSNVPHVPSRDR